MTNIAIYEDLSSSGEYEAEAERLLETFRQENYQRTDRLFAGLMAFQWVAGIVAACIISPRTWIGATSEMHVHVWVAILLGGAISLLPIVFAITRPGKRMTRHVIACGQMLMSALLIHLTGGRIETHFHVFGSLAFLAFYRDWRVLLTATIVVTIDHFLRGVYWPQSVFGVVAASPWRWLEHVAWVAFEDLFLILACLRGVQELGSRAQREARLTALSKLRAEEAKSKAEQEARVRATLDSTADAILTIGEDGSILSCNASTVRMFGFSEAETVGKESSVISQDLCDEIKSDGNGDLKPGEVQIIGEARVISGRVKSGGTFPASVRVTKMNYRGHSLYIATIQDVTQQKRAEEERTRLFTAVRETANHLSMASAEISATMVQEFKGAETQAAAVSSTLATVSKAARSAEESTHLAKDVAQTAQHADQVGKSGRSAIEATRISISNLREQVESTAESILILAERAAAIGEIIQAVNEVAEQTNVLALNAAVEASRAGEAGKGFAVVASEVKSLAEQAKKATAQVRGILSEIQTATNKVVLSTEQGTKSTGQATSVVAKAEETIDELSTMVSQAAKVAGTIVVTSKQQAASMTQVTDSMKEIDRTARQTLAATKQTEHAAKDLNSLGTRLKELIEGENQDLATARRPK